MTKPLDITLGTMRLRATDPTDPRTYRYSEWLPGKTPFEPSVIDTQTVFKLLAAVAKEQT